MRSFHHLPLLGRVRSRDTLAGFRVLDHLDTVEDQQSDIGFVVEEAAAPLEIAVDRGSSPRPADRRRDAVAVEAGRDHPRRHTRRELIEDAPDHPSLLLIHLAKSTDRFAALVQLLHHAIAVGQAAGRIAVGDAADLAALDLGGKVTKEKRVHGALEADMQFVHRAFGQSDDADAREAQALEQGGNVLLIARQPVEGFGHDHIEPAALCIREK